MPVRGFGPEERRLLRHARPGRPRRRGSARRTPASTGSRRSRAPLSTERGDGAPRRGGSATTRPGAGARRAPRRPRRRSRRRPGARRASAAARTSARGTASARPRASTRPSPCSVAHARRERVDALGRDRPGVGDRRTRRRARRGGRRRRAGRSGGGSARSYSSSSTSSTTKHMIAAAPSSSIARGAALVAVGAARSRSGGGRRRARAARRRRRALDRGDRVGVVDRAELVARRRRRRRSGASGVAGSSSVGEARAEASGPRSGRRSPASPAAATSRSDFAFGSVRSWGSTSSAPASGRPQRADHAAGVARRAVGRRGTPSGTRRSAARSSTTSTPGASPRRERVGGAGVAVAVGVLVARQDQPDRVVRVRRPRAPRARRRRPRRRVERRAPRAPRRPRRSRSGHRRRAENSGNGTLRARECRSVVPQRDAARLDADATGGPNETRRAARRGAGRLRRVPGGHAAARRRQRARGGGRARARPRARARAGLGAGGARARVLPHRAASPRPKRSSRPRVEIDPVNDYAHYGLGVCRLRVGDRAGARGHLRLATVMRPDNADYRRALDEASADDRDADAATRSRTRPARDRLLRSRRRDLARRRRRSPARRRASPVCAAPGCASCS